MNRKYMLALLFLIVLTAVSCSSTDKATQVCEQNNTECHQNCSSTNANFTNTRLNTQPVGPCDVRCDNNYQACLKRQENKSIRGISDY